MLNSRDDIYALVRGDARMMDVLRKAASLDLSDWWVGAGFLRNRVWDELSGNEPQRMDADVDLAYFDPCDATPARDCAIERYARAVFPHIPWEIRNQARMHLLDGYEPYTSCADAIAHWPETASAIGCRLNRDGALEILFTHGTDDLLGLIARPVVNDGACAPLELVLQRVETKGWRKRWPGLRVVAASEPSGAAAVSKRA